MGKSTGKKTWQYAVMRAQGAEHWALGYGRRVAKSDSPPWRARGGLSEIQGAWQKTSMQTT